MTSRIVIVTCLLLMAAGCVSKSTYEQQVAAFNGLQAEFSDLQSRYRNLSDDFDALRAKHEALQKKKDETDQLLAACEADLDRAQKDILRLEDVLSTRSAEAGKAMAEMRRRIDELETAKRELEKQVERERLAREARIAKMKTTYDALVGKLEEEIKRGEITISELQGRLTVNMVERILFDSGSADIKPEGLKILARVGDILKNVQDKDILVEGHTDNVPISARLRDRFPSNWELSTARAANVVHFLQDRVGIPGSRLAIVGYGEHRPIADNDTPEGREENRRIQIVLVAPQGHPAVN
ncbi:chemotaxis protein MotB [Geothermobacter ehrlichii]|uniref:Chemotaxis protein MotB n=1 Tax=Geothermobacter ehrlichii TaxID=213224 RepID=A0A5D3WL87_9BACT|nr:OmpA family protein [Geothermobacter ehrlichii]TYO99862.1 chemotaxis protein MotB [Geothermobacter ehrlichii]